MNFKFCKVLCLSLVFVLFLTVSTGCSDLVSAAGANEINVYNWGEYIDESVLDDFEKETGIHVNYFTIDKTCYFVDLPGYGFAKVSQKEKERWGKLMEDYFAAGRIDLGCLIVDYRHAPTNNDITMAQWFLDSGCPFVVIANKMDKLKKSELEPNLKTIREDLGLPDECPIIPFSAEKGNGKDELVKCILRAVKE